MISVGTEAFHYTGWYNNQPDGLLYLNDVLLGYKGNTHLDYITVKDGTRFIADIAFQDCYDLTHISLPEELELIGACAFAGCTQLEAIYSQNPTPPYAYYDWSDSQSNTFSQETLDNAHLYCSSDDYYNQEPWSLFTNTSSYLLDISELRLQVIDEAMGSVSGGGKYLNYSTAYIEAIPNEGYRFVQWSDGDTDNPRQIVVYGDMTLTAEFALITYQLDVQSNDESLGSVIGNSGTYHPHETVTLVAVANGGVTFVQWSDGSTDNPRTVTMTEDITLTAQFAESMAQVTAIPNHATLGEVEQSVTLKAKPVDGASFVQWSDGNTDNPRTIVPTESITLIAEFSQATDVEETAGTSIKLYASEGAIHVVNSPAGVRVVVSDLSGRIVKIKETAEGSTRIALDKGSFLVQVGEHSAKVKL